MPDALIYRVEPQPEGHLYVPDAPNNREGHQAREPSKCLNGWSCEETGQRGLLITRYKRFEKDSDRAITSVAEAVHVPEHFVLPGYPQAKQLHHLHTQLSLGQSCHTQKKILCLCMQGHFGCVQLFVTL